ncbi:hypothetical protein B7P34_16070 [Streptosporangium nondiastaticum]|uniref:Uncharacterized protein n=1 Tax=Streptosporangium nondiastaticum TaxID=35764 RepID=A0A9X7JQ63_9ACTN|nr:hypothetical protein B7P34_16070 [Streptosporangium nondiastaticum]
MAGRTDDLLGAGLTRRGRRFGGCCAFLKSYVPVPCGVHASCRQQESCHLREPCRPQEPAREPGQALLCQ